MMDVVIIDPPADTQASQSGGEANADDAINDPVMGDAHVSQVMNGEDYLLPKSTEADGREKKPTVLVCPPD
jgi:hypothetical protein